MNHFSRGDAESAENVETERSASSFAFSALSASLRLAQLQFVLLSPRFELELKRN
jgi:hypothetical protein